VVRYVVDPLRDLHHVTGRQFLRHLTPSTDSDTSKLKLTDTEAAGRVVGVVVLVGAGSVEVVGVVVVVGAPIP
jgi:hypothetical protein